MPADSAAPDPLAAFLLDAPSRIGRLATPGLVARVPDALRPAAESIARQAAGTWSSVVTDGNSFAVLPSMREFRIGRGFAPQCARVVRMLTEARNPVLREVLDRVDGDREAAILSAFFHHFVAHEFLHVEQRLGSDQYLDSDLYMPIVMEADHVADLASLAVTASAKIPELNSLGEYDMIVLLVAIHIASMQSFAQPGREMDAYAFSRLLTWYLHFARITKGAIAPDLASPTWLQPWIVTLPRLVGRTDQAVSRAILEARAANPYPAGSDMVLAYHHEDGLYRIHRAAFTDEARVLRLAIGIVEARFDDVRMELEELLVGNPALVPTAARTSPAIEWAAGNLFEAVERLAAAARVGGTPEPDIVAAVDSAVYDLRSAVRSSSRMTGAVAELAARVEEEAARFSLAASLPAGPDPSPIWSLKRRVLSLAEQLVLATV